MKEQQGPFNLLTKLIHNQTLSNLEKNNSAPPQSSLLFSSLYIYIKQFVQELKCQWKSRCYLFPYDKP